VQFRILGPLEVTAEDGAPVAVGGPKPRALLVELLLHRGAVVPTDQLVDAVWGDDPPPNAAVALRAYVSRLRSVLPPLAEGTRLRYRAPGYELVLSDDELDATRFPDLVAEARACAAGGDHGRALDLLDTALAMWRGDVLAEFDTATLGAEADVARLADLRLVAIEERAEAMLHLGRGREVIPELETLVARYPYRERLAVLLMRAFYVGGRQTDALAVYGRLRHVLVDELGVEPSEPARGVHRQLLAHDPVLLPPVLPRPTNLPRRTTGFVGRGDERTEVTAALGAAPLVTLTGVGGVGKSRLALEVAEAQRERFPDGVWLCELAPLPGAGPVSQAVAAALRVQQRHGLTIEQTVIEYLRTRQVLLLLDNCEHLLDAAARLVAQIVADCPGVVVLATSRESLRVDGEQVWPVPPLSEADATALFVQRARASNPGFRLDGEAGPVAELCRRLDRLPLAIELAAARMRVMNATEMARRLDGEQLRVPGARTAEPRHRSLAAAIDWSYRLLSQPEQQLFARLSVFWGAADFGAIHTVCAEPDHSEADTLGLLTALIDKSLVVVKSDSGVSRYRVLETLRAYGRERRPRDDELPRKHARYFVGLAEEAAKGMRGAEERTWVERTLPDVDNLRAAFERVMADRDADLAMRLVTALPEVLHIRVGYEAAGWAERALDLAPADHPLFVAGVGAAARGAWNVGDFARARRLAALAGGRAPARGTARTAYPADVLADIALYKGDPASALRHYESEAVIARRDGEPVRLVWTLYYVAVCHSAVRTPELGIPAAEESLTVAEVTANPTARSMARYALGLVLKKSDPARALALFDEARTLAASVHNFWWEGIALMEAAATRAVHRDAAAAARALADVLDHWDRAGDWTQQWLNLRYIVRLLVRLGRDEDAVVLHSCLLAAGKPSPLDAVRLGLLRSRLGAERFASAESRSRGLSSAAAVDLARAALRRAD
jgi:predicted ATPase/DNA-binding SARP family transcriptional activator